MESAVRTLPVPKWKLWTGRVISAIAILFLLFDSVAKLMKLAPVKQACLELGYPESLIVPIGALFPIYAGALMWVGLYLRDARLRVLNPLES